MAKLRKMLGDPTGPRAKALMALIDTQSASTLGRWAAAYAEERYLPILSRRSGQPVDDRFATAIKQAIACADGNATLKDAKPALRAALAAARETGDADPVAQAAARAISTACGVIQTPTNALGFAFYGAAAAAYDQAGLSADSAEYERLADTEFDRIIASLRHAAVDDEPNPVKVRWNC
ncbi:putative immunity protein [Bifidobacterium pullorum]|uniref:putative immunity protein n=1 Tax=Bifidobacterium pullorum TaxID=78448 RepID=UPI00242FD89C|nr:hypothetical protein [Bifidobacterium pullorum]